MKICGKKFCLARFRKLLKATKVFSHVVKTSSDIIPKNIIWAKDHEIQSYKGLYVSTIFINELQVDEELLEDEKKIAELEDKMSEIESEIQRESDDFDMQLTKSLENENAEEIIVVEEIEPDSNNEERDMNKVFHTFWSNRYKTKRFIVQIKCISLQGNTRHHK